MNPSNLSGRRAAFFWKLVLGEVDRENKTAGQWRHGQPARGAVACGLCWFFGLSLPSLVAVAQTPEFSIQFTVFSAIPIRGLCYAPDLRADLIDLTFYPTARSPRYRYHGASPLRIYQHPEGATVEQSDALVAEVSLPTDVTEAVILFFPGGGNSASSNTKRYHCEVIEDGAKRLGASGLTIGNFSRLILRGTINGKPVVLERGLNPSMAVGRIARLALSTPFKERSYRSYADDVEIVPGERALLLLFPPFRPGSLEVQSRLLIDEAPSLPPVK